MEARSVPQTPGKLALTLRATRLPYIPTSLLPGIAGCLVALGSDDATWWLAPVAILALFFVHGGTDITNEVEDFARGVDTEDKMDNSRVFNTGLMSVVDGRRAAAAFLAIAFGLAILIALVQGPAVLALGAVGILGGFLYTGGPRPYKYVGLGDVMIVFLMGPLMLQGTYTAVTGDPFHAPAFFVGFVPGLLITATLEANNLADIPGDARAGVTTLAVRLGFQRARTLFIASLSLAYVAVVGVWAAGLFDWPILVVLLTGPLAIGRARQALRARDTEDSVLLTLAPRTAQLHILSALLLIVGVVGSEAF